MTALMNIDHRDDKPTHEEESVVTDRPSSQQPRDVPPAGSEPQGNITVIAAIGAIVVIVLIVLVVLIR